MDSIEYPSLVGRRIALQPVGPEHYGFIYSLVSTPPTAQRWRLRGAVPNQDAFVRLLWNDVLVQWVVLERDSGAPIGLVQLTNPDDRNGFAYLGVVLAADFMGRGWPLESVTLAIDYAFLSFPYRKLYFETDSYIAQDFSSAVGRFLVEECRLKDHVFMGGELHDHLIFALYRESWSEHVSTFRRYSERHAPPPS